MVDTPRQRVEAACARDGREDFVRRCVALFDGGPVDPQLVRVLAGAAAKWGLNLGPEQAYWLRVWAVRGLLWAWAPQALPALRRACHDEAWRVREMAAKVVARHHIGDALGDVAELVDDPVARVRATAQRALRTLTAAQA